MESLKEQHAIVAASVSGEDWWILKKGDIWRGDVVILVLNVARRYFTCQNLALVGLWMNTTQ